MKLRKYVEIYSYDKRSYKEPIILTSSVTLFFYLVSKLAITLSLFNEDSSAIGGICRLCCFWLVSFSVLVDDVFVGDFNVFSIRFIICSPSSVFPVRYCN